MTRSLPPNKEVRRITLSEARGFINGIIAVTDIAKQADPISFLIGRCLQQFGGGISPLVLRPLVLIELYKEGAPRMVIESARKDIVTLRDFCLDYPEINARLDLIDKAFDEILIRLSENLDYYQSGEDAFLDSKLEPTE